MAEARSFVDGRVSNCESKDPNGVSQRRTMVVGSEGLTSDAIVLHVSSLASAYLRSSLPH